MVNVIPFPQGSDKPYNVKPELFKRLSESKMPQVIIDLFTKATVKGTNPISTEQWNLNSFAIRDDDPERGGIGIVTDFREVHAPLFLIKENIDYLGIKYFSRNDQEKLQPVGDVNLSMLLSSYMRYLPPIASDCLLFVVNVLDAIDQTDDLTVHGFTLDQDSMAVKFSHTGVDHQHYGFVFDPLPLVLDTLANNPQFKKES